MSMHNEENERIKRRYVRYLGEAAGYSEASTDQVLAALDRFEIYTRRKSFRAFHIQQAVGFKRHLASQTSKRSGKPLSRATANATLNACRKFFLWLADQPGYRRRIGYSDADYFRLTDKEVRIARAHLQRPVPTLEQVHHVLRRMPAETDIEKRDRALIALLALTGARDGAIASLQLKHVDPEAGKLLQDAREVKTKFSKSLITWFFPVGGAARPILEAWCSHLKTGLLYGPDDPLFPATGMGHDEHRRFRPAGLRRARWANAGPVRRIVGDAFAAAEMPRFHPHGFRHMLVQLGERICHTPEEFKAWSQNLGHEKVMTTFNSYGTVAPHRQAEIMQVLDRQADGEPGRRGEPDRETVRWVLDSLRERQAL